MFLDLNIFCFLDDKCVLDHIMSVKWQKSIFLRLILLCIEMFKTKKVLYMICQMEVNML